MALVTLHAVDTAVPPNDVEGLLARVYSGGVLLVEGLSGTDGRIELELPLGSYLVRFSSNVFAPYRVTSPQALSVTGAATYRITVERFAAPLATDPALCRISGYLRDPFGLAWAGRKLVVTPSNAALVIGDTLVQPRQLTLTIASDGYVELDLVRGQTYVVRLYPHDEADIGAPNAPIIVPDQPSAVLHGLLFPFPTAVVFPASAIELAAGEQTILAVEEVWSDAVARGRLYSTLHSSDEGVCTTEAAIFAVTVLGVAAGEAVITCSYASATHHRRVVSGRLAVTVT